MGAELTDVDMARVRAAVAGVVHASAGCDWPYQAPDQVLLETAAPFEVLTFHYYLEPPDDRHLLRAARVMCDVVAAHLPRCPSAVAQAFAQLRDAVERTP